MYQHMLQLIMASRNTIPIQSLDKAIDGLTLPTKDRGIHCQQKIGISYQLVSTIDSIHQLASI